MNSKRKFWNLKIKFKSEKYLSVRISISNVDPAKWWNVQIFNTLATTCRVHIWNEFPDRIKLFQIWIYKFQNSIWDFKRIQIDFQEIEVLGISCFSWIIFCSKNTFHATSSGVLWNQNYNMENTRQKCINTYKLSNHFPWWYFFARCDSFCLKCQEIRIRILAPFMSNCFFALFNGGFSFLIEVEYFSQFFSEI